MKPRRGKAVAVLISALGLGVLGVSGFLFRDQLAREWRLWDSRAVYGSVRFSGQAPPASAPIAMLADPNCASLHRTPVFPEDVVINSNQTLKNVLVFVSSGLEGKTFPDPSDRVVLDQVGCRYVPHVFGIQVRQPLEVRNSDSTIHNVHALTKNSRQFNDSLPTRGMTITRRFTRAEHKPPLKILCRVHPWMAAWCGVFDHPFFAVTDDNGEFTIPNLPPGKYTLTAWHEKFGEQNRTIEVPAWGSRRANFDYQGE